MIQWLFYLFASLWFDDYGSLNLCYQYINLLFHYYLNKMWQNGIVIFVAHDMICWVGLFNFRPMHLCFASTLPCGFLFNVPLVCPCCLGTFMAMGSQHPLRMSICTIRAVVAFSHYFWDPSYQPPAFCARSNMPFCGRLRFVIPQIFSALSSHWQHFSAFIDTWLTDIDNSLAKVCGCYYEFKHSNYDTVVLGTIIWDASKHLLPWHLHTVMSICVCLCTFGCVRLVIRWGYTMWCWVGQA